MTSVCEIGVCVCVCVCVCVYRLENNNCSKCKVTKDQACCDNKREGEKKEKKDTCRQ